MVLIKFSIGFVLFFYLISIDKIRCYSLKRNNVRDNSLDCESNICMKYAETVLKYMNQSVDPCESFYDYSCGAFVKNEPIPEDQESQEVISIIDSNLQSNMIEILSEKIFDHEPKDLANLKKYYASCVGFYQNKTNINSKILEFMNEKIGKWPVNNVSNKFNFFELHRQVFFYASPLFDLYITKNPNIHNIRIDQASFKAMGSYGSHEFETKYKSYISNIIKLTDSKVENLDEIVNGIYEIESGFAKLQTSIPMYRNLNITIKQLQDSLPKFEWKDFIINFVFKNLTDINIDENEYVRVTDMNYFTNVVELFSNYSINRKTDLYNYLIWTVFEQYFMGFMSNEFQSVAFEFDKFYSGMSVQLSKEKFCYHKASKYMSYSLSKLYVIRYFETNTKHFATKIFVNLVDEFRIMLNNTEWSDQSSKIKILDKLDSLGKKIGYPDFLFNNESFIDTLYDFEMDSVDFFNNSLILTRNLMRNSLNILRMNNYEIWRTSPVTVNAIYSPEENHVYIPAGILQFPIFDSYLPNYVNYASYGPLVAHELVHGFDNKGRLFDKDGRFFSYSSNGLWSVDTVNAFINRSSCFVDQYNNYTIAQINKKVDGGHTLSENIADSVGLKLSFKSFRKLDDIENEPAIKGLEKFTKDQLFFITYAQTYCSKARNDFMSKTMSLDKHAPNDVRVLGSTSNLQEFSEVFNCKPAQRNNPIKKCDLW